jgi:hypothetical protein
MLTLKLLIDLIERPSVQLRPEGILLLVVKGIQVSGMTIDEQTEPHSLTGTHVV